MEVEIHPEPAREPTYSLVERTNLGITTDQGVTVNFGPFTIVVYVALAALVLYRVVYKQLRGTLLSRKSLITMPLILTVLGVVTVARALPAAGTGELVMFGADIVVLIVLGLGRSASTSLTARGNTTWQKGSALTLVLWLATIGARVGFGFLGGYLGFDGGLTSASILLTMGLSIGVQNALTYYRIQQRGLPLAEQSRPAVRA
ncbi:hypothetical protein VSH64_34370 [Amycolatopsis rhabdoformis]|uniref:DUF1453 domain-containing protein n=1 Tax=Amycolatopsis rhabdoformis TaxID=1448059 RepID=A0ABZ1I118_9PSEU|nr:hypothetical protein [Amycolatopsis rhabdoformis]WSE27905.1 hypothetical protein VSH64_34370 [Amycolatopsis rhabdoformis]